VQRRYRNTRLRQKRRAAERGRCANPGTRNPADLSVPPCRRLSAARQSAGACCLQQCAECTHVPVVVVGRWCGGVAGSGGGQEAGGGEIHPLQAPTHQLSQVEGRQVAAGEKEGRCRVYRQAGRLGQVCGVREVENPNQQEVYTGMGVQVVAGSRWWWRCLKAQTTGICHMAAAAHAKRNWSAQSIVRQYICPEEEGPCFSGST